MLNQAMSPILFPLRRIASGDDAFGGMPPFFGAVSPLPAAGGVIAGVSRDRIGAPIGGCICTLFRVVTTGLLPNFIQVGCTVSDGSGNYSFVVGFDGPYRVTFDLPGAPTRAGITLKTLSGA